MQFPKLSDLSAVHLTTLLGKSGSFLIFRCVLTLSGMFAVVFTFLCMLEVSMGAFDVFSMLPGPFIVSSPYLDFSGILFFRHILMLFDIFSDGGPITRPQSQDGNKDSHHHHHVDSSLTTSQQTARTITIMWMIASDRQG